MPVLTEALHEPPFQLTLPRRGRLHAALVALLRGPLERVLHFPEMNAIYSHVARMDDRRHFVDKVLTALHVDYAVAAEELARVPRTGPCIVVANHPFGALEGIVLAALLRTVRPDVKIMANYLLRRIPELRDLMIFVDPFGGKDAPRHNLRAVRDSVACVKAGGMLGIFPAGEVSHIDLQRRVVTDPRWSDTVARLVRLTGAPVLPVFFDGANGPLFQIMGLVHARLRTVMLPHELLNKQRTTIGMSIGTPIPFAKLKAFAGDRDMTAYLRLRTYILKTRREPEPAHGAHGYTPPAKGMAPIIPAEDPALLAAEIAALPPEQVLASNGGLHVIVAQAPQIPHVLREIGRLREVTFRKANEGTGKALDLDAFDQYYAHLFVWNADKSELVGAYRMGRTDEILERHGLSGLYTSTLFDFQPELLERISPALELGRSFVRPEYQRSFSPLMLLWRGIGTYVCRYPRYRMLFGPVSINADYRSLSRELMVAFLRANRYLPHLGRLVRAKHPPPRGKAINALDPRAAAMLIHDVDDVSDVISEMESDQKGIPILIKQYLKLGGRLLGFNVDPDFASVLDGLLLTDLTKTDPKILERYMGKENAAGFFAHHAKGAEARRV